MKRSFYLDFLIFLLFVILNDMSPAQPLSGLTGINPLFDPGKNQLLFFGDAGKTYADLYRQFNGLVLRGEGNIHVVHIGDSHIQAGIFTGELRKDLSEWFAPGCGARGLVFPYRMARTNNPADYSVKFTGQWEYCRNIEPGRNCNLGLTGIMVRTKDSISEIMIRLKKDLRGYDFNAVKLFSDTLTTAYRIEFPDMAGRYRMEMVAEKGYTRVSFEHYYDSLYIRIVRIDTADQYFTLHGIEFENGDPGIIYSAAGVNGAEVTSFLNCNLLRQDLSVIMPSWIILSLGTNDAYKTVFDKTAFERNYNSLIREIRQARPGVPILLTVPADSYRRKRYDNKNLVSVRDAIYNVARDNDCAVWDLYTLMGGARSILKWYKAGLAAKDKLHFTKQGYILQGKLLFDAVANSYISFIDASK